MPSQAIDIHSLALELLSAHATTTSVPVPPSAREGEFDLRTAYQVESEIVRARQQAGRTVRGLKVGFANKAMWRALKIDTLLWAHMYDDTVQYAAGGQGELNVSSCYAPRIEPEIVFCWRKPITAPGLDAATVLADHVEWIALGFEIIDCPYPDWKFQPSDFVASMGLHRALIVGDPMPIDSGAIPELVDQLARFTVKLYRNGELAEEGAGKNSLKNPALCLAELGSALLQAGANEPIGDLVSSGTLTTGRDIARGETWRAEVAGLALKPLELRLV